MVGAEGFEPPTLCSQSRCATRLRYAPITTFDCNPNGIRFGSLNRANKHRDDRASSHTPGPSDLPLRCWPTERKSEKVYGPRRRFAPLRTASRDMLRCYNR